MAVLINLVNNDNFITGESGYEKINIRFVFCGDYCRAVIGADFCFG